MELCDDLFMRGERKRTPPVVWLTLDDRLDGTIATKVLLAGYPDPAQHIYRFVLPAEYGCIDLHDFADNHHIDRKWLNCLVMTGGMAGSHWRDWRLCEREIPAVDWLRLEILTDIDEAGKTYWDSYSP